MKTGTRNYTEQTYLYEAYDAFGNLLYVGITNDLKRRLNEHRRSAKWWTQQTEVRHTYYASRDEAKEQESRVIAERSPGFNIAETDKHAEAVRVSWQKRKEQKRNAPRFIVSPRETVALLSVQQIDEVDELIELLTAIKTFQRSSNGFHSYLLDATTDSALRLVRLVCRSYGVDSVRWAASNE
jgi:predicted GIY-YIG superfamily endonuclease